MSTATIKSLVVMLLEGFPSSANTTTDAVVNAYATALTGIELQYIKLACGRFIRGHVERQNHSFAPSAAEMSREAQRLQADAQRAAQKGDGLTVYRIGAEPPEGTVPLGPTKVDYGDGPIDMSWMTPDQKRRVITSRGRDVPGREESRELMRA